MTFANVIFAPTQLSSPANMTLANVIFAGLLYNLVKVLVFGGAACIWNYVTLLSFTPQATIPRSKQTVY